MVEDDAEAAAVLARGLREHSYAVDVVGDGQAALDTVAVSDYDAVILDVMLPVRDGLSVCRALRDQGLATPVLMLTARDEVASRVLGLDSGADDYLTKPFELDELLARLRALLRRGPALRPSVIEIGDLVLDTRTRRVERAGRPIELTAKEYALLEFLARRAGEVVGRAEISEHVWDATFDAFSNRIEVYVQRLRRKIDDGSTLKLIRTRRGEGYTLSAAADA
jgi:two-component system copper resistance phosphate regulon response regulator CusR